MERRIYFWYHLCLCEFSKKIILSRRKPWLIYEDSQTETKLLSLWLMNGFDGRNMGRDVHSSHFGIHVWSGASHQSSGCVVGCAMCYHEVSN